VSQLTLQKKSLLDNRLAVIWYDIKFPNYALPHLSLFLRAILPPIVDIEKKTLRGFSDSSKI
jgi:hypothetical protein